MNKVVVGMIFYYKSQLHHVAYKSLNCPNYWVCRNVKGEARALLDEGTVLKGHEAYENETICQRIGTKKKIYKLTMGPNLNNTQKEQVRTLIGNLNSMIRAGWLILK